MSLPTVFISYNPQSDVEMTLAVRLHTIGGVNGLQINLPDRMSFQRPNLTEETKHRIRTSQYFLVFSTGSLSATVSQEIQYAFTTYNDSSKIIVIYDKHIGGNLQLAKKCTEIFIDPSDDLSTTVNSITSGIKSLHSKSNETSIGLGGLILAGLGLFALASLFDHGAPPRKRIPRKTSKKGTTPKKRKR